MNMLAKGTIILSLFTALLIWAQSSPPSPPEPQVSISEIATNFTHYQQITKSAVLVNRELALLCRGVSKQDVDAARVKFGPHANTAIFIYMNKPAAAAFGTNASEFPVGSVIVKQKSHQGYIDKNGLRVREADSGVGGMVKRPPGYDPKHGDWEYFYFEDTKKIETGRIASCVQCHEAAKEKDYVFGTWREKSR